MTKNFLLAAYSACAMAIPGTAYAQIAAPITVELEPLAIPITKGEEVKLIIGADNYGSKYAKQFGYIYEACPTASQVGTFDVQSNGVSPLATLGSHYFLGTTTNVNGTLTQNYSPNVTPDEKTFIDKLSKQNPCHANSLLNKDALIEMAIEAARNMLSSLVISKFEMFNPHTQHTAFHPTHVTYKLSRELIKKACG